MKAGVVLGVVGVVAAVVVAVMVMPRGEREVIGESVVPGLMDRLNDVAKVELISGEQRLEIVRDGEGWVLPSKTGYAAKPDRVRPTLIGIAEMKRTDARTSNAEMYARVGVEDPTQAGATGTLVVMRDASGEEIASVIVGRAAREGLAEQRYVRLPSEAQTWLAEASIDVSLDAGSWLDRALTRIGGERVQSMVVVHADGEEVGLSKAEAGQAHYDVAPIPAGFVLRSAGIADPMTKALTNLNFEDVRGSSGRLDKVPVSVVYQTFDGLLVSIDIYDDEGENWAVLRADSMNDEMMPEGLEELSKRFEGREFRIAAWAATNMSRRMSELVDAAPEEPLEGDEPIGPVLPGSGG